MTEETGYIEAYRWHDDESQARLDIFSFTDYGHTSLYTISTLATLSSKSLEYSCEVLRLHGIN
jgi:hypothetical protein